MGYRDTKQEGPAANAVSAMVSLLVKTLGMNDTQGVSVFSELARRAPQNRKAPTIAEWKAFIKDAHALVDDADLSVKRAASLHKRLDAAIAGKPAPRVWFALQNFSKDAAARMETLNAYLNQIARINDRDTIEVAEEFWARVATAGTARANGDGRETRTVFHGHVPSDFATITVLTDMRREAVQTAGITNVEHTTVAHGIVTSYGYDAATSRLEVNMAGSVYAYRVPQSVIDEIVILDHSTDEVASFISRNVFANPAYQWEAGASIRICPACATPVAQVHVCHGPASAPYADGVVVDLDPGAERIAADGTVLVLLRQPGARADLVANGTLTAPIVVITAADATAETFGARHVVTGDVTITADGVDASALACSCPAVGCTHPQVAGEQVRQMVLFGIVPDAADVTD